MPSLTSTARTLHKSLVKNKFVFSITTSALDEQEPIEQMRKYINADMRIQKKVKEYDSRQSLEYLRAVANNNTLTIHLYIRGWECTRFVIKTLHMGLTTILFSLIGLKILLLCDNYTVVTT